MEPAGKHRFSLSLLSSDEADSSDYDDYYGDDNDPSDDILNIHPLLEGDMKRVKLQYGPEAISTRMYPSVDSVDVELLLGTEILDREIAKAWKIKPEENIVIRLHLSVTHYLDGEVPKVEVFQPSQRERFGVGSQLRKILENFLLKHWTHMTNADVESQLRNPDSSTVSRHSLEEDSALRSSCSQMAVSDNTEALCRIMEMGFSMEMAKNALCLSGNDISEAINMLLSDTDYSLDTKVAPLSSGKVAVNKKKLRQRNVGSHADSSKPSMLGSVFSKITSKACSLMKKRDCDPKQHPGLEQGFLVMILRYAYQRLPALNEFCVVCDERHVFESAGMLKPTVCARELCTFAFLSLGVMSDAADDIATGADVVNLLIVMAMAACQSPRRDVIFEPFPTVVNPHNNNELALSPEKKDFNAVKRILDNFLPISDMVRLYGAELKETMDRKDILAYPLLQWIISSNRSHIVKLPAEKQLDFMQTPHQFLLLSSPPAKEAIFREARKQFGSTFAFHGSPLENWHAILRQGLINASGTKYQRHGAAYGHGIYLSPDASVSFGYSGMRHNNASVTRQRRSSRPAVKHFLGGSNLTCVALCEVILSDSLKRNGNIWVMPEPNHVCTRFFFVYESAQIGDGGINTVDEKYLEKIQSAVLYHAS